ncbi:MAG: bacteriohopanetetrol glucosamine biosynthesis glycosyltransferase HpnI [Candidatus Eremiobacteraeota bacterium]|nr:bacteriohopanetetrol glucosamine biosynthesis glycosyltransferase HpnI [Candidatus Eremiobacteraeota bacterium]
MRDASKGRRVASPPITILKPLCGLEPELFENLASFCDQAYSQFQVIFGARDAADPAVAVAQRVIKRFPERDLALVACDAAAVANPKIANVLNMLPQAKHPLLVISDADMRVDRHYLERIAATFDDELVGAATALYAGDPLDGLASELGAMFVNEQFAPSVLVALALGPLAFCFGSTMAVRRSVLDELGGLEALGAHAGDDYLLGKAVADRGKRVALIDDVVRNVIREPSLGALWAHELRWARTIFAQRPLGYLGSFVTLPLPFALAALAFAPGVTTVAVLAAVAALRLALHAQARRVLNVRERAALIPLRDVFSLAIWAASFFTRDIRWRTDRFSLDREGRIAPKRG